MCILVITIKFNATNGFCELQIEDDGQGIAESSDESVDGMGLKIMRHRANLIGAQFSVTAADSGGTRVLCRVRQDGNASKPE